MLKKLTLLLAASGAGLLPSAPTLAGKTGLCVLFDPSAGPAALRQEISTPEDCTPAKASERGWPLSGGFGPRPRLYSLQFHPSAPLVEACATSTSPASPLAVDEAAAQLSPTPFSESSLSEIARLRVVQDDTGMSLAEMVAIRAYMGWGFKEMNESLRTGRSHGPMWDARIALATAGLEHLGENNKYLVNGLVKRSVPSAVALDRLYPEGSCVTEAAFTSASQGDIADGATLFGSRNIFILAKRGRDVSPLAAGKMAREKEVLFPPGTKFRVRNAFGAEKVVLEECPCAAE